MTFNPALKVPMLLVSLFLLIIGVVIAGSLWYRQTTSNLTSTADYQSVSEKLPTEQRESVYLKIVPIDANNLTYKLIITGLTQPASGLVFQMVNDPNDAQIVSKSITTDSNLQNSGWTTAINSTTEVDSGQQLSFSLVLNSPNDPDLVPSIEIGTITFDQTPSTTQLNLNQEESYVVYRDNSIAPMNLILETDTMDNK